MSRQLNSIVRRVLLEAASQRASETRKASLNEIGDDAYMPLPSISAAPPDPRGRLGFWEEAIDSLLPGTPVKDGYEIINTFSDIVKRRLEYNKKNGLPPETKTKEEIAYRERLLKSTPFFGYPSGLEFLSVIEDVKTGKDVRAEVLKDRESSWKQKFKDPSDIKKSDEKYSARQDRREELKRMWLDIDDPEGLTKGHWVKSTFKPASSKDPNAVYYMPSEMPTLTTKEFDQVYGAIMKTRRPDGTFPGGNSRAVFDDVDISHLFDSSKISDSKVRGLAKNDLGNFKFGAGEEGGKKYISVYDEWDLFPPALTDMGINIQQFGKIPLIYYRIYR
jgi:hypothetical protein